MPRRPGRALRETQALHALAHPLRVRILEQLREPASAAEVARRLNESRQNLNYHLKELARGGFARRTGTRRVGGFTETLYQASADSVVVSLHVAAAAGAPVESIQQVRAATGRGLEGDRYFDGTGTFSRKPGTGRHVTLIELEAIRALLAEQGVTLDP